MMPLSEKEVWKIRDSSKLSDYETCPRLYFYKHILGWRNEAPNQDAYFGESWHRAREHMLLHGYDDLSGAYHAFESHYRKEFPEDTDELYTPKIPEAVLLALPKFAARYKDDLLENEVLYTEISGTVPVDEKRNLYFRMDSILQNNQGMIFSWDHKTTKRFSRQWEEKFHLSIQNGTYTHCMYCLYPIEQVKGVEFCGIEFNYLKKGSRTRPAGFNFDFKRVPAWKNPRQMNNWLWQVTDLLDDIDRDMDRLFHCDDSDPIMMAFRLNDESCTKYWGCPFHDYCMTWGNPLRHCAEPPLGMIEEFWDPTKLETTHKMNLEWKA